MQGSVPEKGGTLLARRWCFGEVVLDDLTLELTVAGRRVEVEGKPLEVLRQLLLHANQVVGKDHLAAACWPGRILSDSVLSKALSKLREALGDDEQQIIKTLYGQGYRLVAPVRIEMPEAASASVPPRAEEDRRGSPAPSKALAQAERRQLTVMVCDLVNSAALAQRLDAEAFRELMLSYQQVVADIVERHEGQIAQYLGDGLLIYFGHPAAHDDDAERAVRAGCEILGAVQRLQAGQMLQTRIGVHSGPVVIGLVGAGPRQETLALGDTSNLASCIHDLAQPQTLVISAATLRLVPGLFVTRDLGAPALKGVTQPLRLHQVLQPGAVRSRLEAAERLTPFVGRETELALLADRWQQAREGQGQVLLVSAEPGLGKSRLLMTLREWLRDDAHRGLECRCSSLKRNSAFAPVLESLARELCFMDSDSDALRLQKLEQALNRFAPDSQDALALLAPLFNLNLPQRDPPSAHGPELKRRKILELLSGWMLAQVQTQAEPRLLIFEDLHWADPSTLDLLQLLIEQAAAQKILLLLTARPEFAPPWPQRAHVAALSLPALHGREADALLEHLTAGRTLPAPVKERVLQQAGGVPLFLEEITKALLESDQPESLAVPTTLQDSLMARLDRQGEAKVLIQLCAVVGREISYALLMQIAGMDEAALQAQLQSLIGAQLLYPRGSPPQAHYLFKHALIQDTAYQSLLKSTRQKLHGRIAAVLEQQAAEPALLAEHFDKAGLAEQAVKYYQAAAGAAASRAAPAEAVTLLEKALALLPAAPAGATRDRQELTLLTQLITWLNYSRGHAHPDIGPLLQRARQLLAAINDPMAQAAVLNFSWTFHAFGGQPLAAVEDAAAQAALGRTIALPALESVGYSNCAHSCYLLGRLGEAQTRSEEALRFKDLEGGRQFALMAGVEPRIYALWARAVVRWLAGYPDEARSLALEAAARAEAIQLPLVSCFTASWVTPSILRLLGQAEALLQACEAAAALSERYGYQDAALFVSANEGIALGLLSRRAEGLALIRQSMQARQTRGTKMMLAWDEAAIAAICLAGGQREEARAALTRAFGFMEKYDERMSEAELHRLQGELALAPTQRSPLSPNEDASGAERRKGAAESAEACFHKALEVARTQGARSLELRAALSLARLWQAQKRVTEARKLLKPIYGAFTEGFDTQDLKEARALLDRLAI